MNIPNLRGVGVALVTPFDSKGEIRFDQYENLINYVIDNGVDYLIVLGSTGEAITLDPAEKLAVIKKSVEVVKKRVPIIVGVSGSNTLAVVKDVKTYGIEGVDAILSAAPAYNKPSQVGIYEHYKAIATSTNLPIILYNVPGRTACNIDASTVLKLADDFENIIAVKEAGNDWDQFLTLAKNKPDCFYLLSGNDNLIFPQISYGFDGVISVIGNALPKLFSTMVHRALDGQIEDGRKILFAIDDIISMIFAQGNPAGVKCALTHLEIIDEYLRLPLTPVNQELRDMIGEEVGFLKLK
ncbi:MAG: 4-hydroxy-tetrahydrodipicolinate synthase [Chitinophagales bacterium]|nr:4-hydroxy-tetrahydrodipicolinate synthase [Chitinophagales bacterium]